jgi:hypothetical protein
MLLILYLPKVLILIFSTVFYSDMVILGFYENDRPKDSIIDAE